MQHFNAHAIVFSKKPKNPNSCLKTLAGMAGDAKNIGEVVGKNSLKLADAVLPY
jgi:hypothetical protein